MKNTIIFPCRNEEQGLPECLEKAKTISDTEVIVVDNMSTDGSYDIARKYKTKFDMKIIRELVAKLQRTFNWYHERSLLPYDWNSYVHKDWMELIHLLRIDFTGKLKKKDKRGSWR